MLSIFIFTEFRLFNLENLIISYLLLYYPNIYNQNVKGKLLILFDAFSSHANTTGWHTFAQHVVIFYLNFVVLLIIY